MQQITANCSKLQQIAANSSKFKQFQANPSEFKRRQKRIQATSSNFKRVQEWIQMYQTWMLTRILFVKMRKIRWFISRCFWDSGIFGFTLFYNVFFVVLSLNPAMHAISLFAFQTTILFSVSIKIIKSIIETWVHLGFLYSTMFSWSFLSFNPAINACNIAFCFCDHKNTKNCF